VNVVMGALRRVELFERGGLAHAGVALVNLGLVDLSRDLLQPVPDPRRALLQPVHLSEQHGDAFDPRRQLEVALLELACDLEELGGSGVCHGSQYRRRSRPRVARGGILPAVSRSR